MQRAGLLSSSPPLSRIPRRERGRILAGILADAWKPVPPPCLRSPEEISPLLPLLTRRGTSGLAWRGLRESPLAGLPEGGILLDGYRFQTLTVRLRETELREVLMYFRSEGIEPLVFKGWSVGRHYPEAGLRPYGDLDLLVPPGQYRKAVRLWSREGRPQAPVELHASLRHLRDRPLEGILARSRRAELGGTSIRVLALEDHLRLLALHALEHGLASPLWLCDLAVLMEGPCREDPEFRWERVLTGDPWLTEGVRLALTLTRELLGVDLEAAGVPGPWLRPPLPPWVVPAALDALGAEAHYMDVPDPGSVLLRPGALLRAARLRWANPLEATYRMGAPWEGPPRLAVQAVDYLSRGRGFLEAVPRNLGYLVRTRRGR